MSASLQLQSKFSKIFCRAARTANNRIIQISLLILVISGCAIFPAGYTPVGKALPASLQNKQWQLTFSSISTGARSTHYWASVTIKNVGQSEAVFDGGDVELTDLNSGVTYFSIGKDKTSVTIQHQVKLILRERIRPGQAIEGVIQYETMVGRAIAKKLRSSWDGKSIDWVQ